MVQLPEGYYAMGNAWDSTVRNLGISGLKWLFPEDMLPKAKQMGLKSPLEKFIEKLRSGEDMPASAATILADIIEEAYPYKLQLMPVQKNIRKVNSDVDCMDLGLEIERLQRDENKSLSEIMAILANCLGIDERTIKRRWCAYKKMRPVEISLNSPDDRFGKFK